MLVVLKLSPVWCLVQKLLSNKLITKQRQQESIITTLKKRLKLAILLLQNLLIHLNSSNNLNNRNKFFLNSKTKGEIITHSSRFTTSKVQMRKMTLMSLWISVYSKASCPIFQESLPLILLATVLKLYAFTSKISLEIFPLSLPISILW